MDTVNTSFGKPSRMWGRVVANHTFVKALAENSQGHQITLFVPSAQDVVTLQNTLLREISCQVTVVPFFAIPDFLRTHPVDVLHSLDPNMESAGHIRNFLSPRPFVITGVTHSLANEHFLSWALKGSANGIDRNDCLICTTPTAKTVIDSALGRLAETQPDFRAPQTCVIPLGMEPQTPGGDRDELRANLGISPQEFVVLSLGRLDPLSKMDYLPILNLITQTADRGDRPIRFILAGASGEGDYVNLVREWIDKLGIQRHTALMLDLEEQQKHDLYHAADAFLTLSDNLQETFGLTVVEALTAGLPVIASDWNGYKALVEHGKTGYLVPTKTLAPNLEWEAALGLQQDSMMHLFVAQTTAVDLNIAGEHILDLAADPALTARMSQAALEAAGHYALERVTGLYLETWQTLSRQFAAAESTSAATRSSLLRVLEDFSCYASSALTSQDRFVASALGNQILERKRALYLYGQLAEIMDLRILNQILKACTEARMQSEVVQHVQQELTANERQINLNLMWLYKYGYIETA